MSEFVLSQYLNDLLTFTCTIRKRVYLELYDQAIHAALKQEVTTN